MSGSRVPTVSPGWISGGNRSVGQVQGGQELRGPLPRDGVEEPGGGGVGGLGAALAGQQEPDEVRDEQRLQPVQFRLRGELVDRVERQELQPGGGVEPGRIEFLVDPGDGGTGPVIAVAERRRDQVAGGVDQPVVHGPGVDPDAGDALAAGRGRRGGGREPGEDLGEQRVEVPAEAAVELLDPVGEPVHGLQLGPRPTGTARDPAQDDPARGGADVDCGESTAGTNRRTGRRRPPLMVSGAHRRKAAATPASTGMWSPVVWESSLPVSTAAALATFSGSTSRLSRVRWA